MTDWFDGRRAAVSLTYDDGLPVHHTAVAPLLEAHGLRGTFYATIDSDLIDAPEAWRAVAEAGHEIGNHTVFHPCRRRSPDGSEHAWLRHRHDLRRFTLDEWKREVTLANRVVKLIDGRDSRSFGNTCHDTEVGPDDDRVSIGPAVADLFVAGRGACTGVAADPATADLTSIGCAGADRRTFAELKPQIDAAIEAGHWLIYCAHGVGEGHTLRWEADEHRRTVEYLAERADDVWAAPVADIATRIAAARG